MQSPLAVQVSGVRNPAKDGRKRKAWGLLLHTTGGGVTDLALFSRKTVGGKIVRTRRTKPLRPLDVALKLYIESQNGSNGYLWGGPHYVLDHDGGLYQIAPDNILTAHCGGEDRTRYLDGSWRRECSAAALAAWDFKWGKSFKNPYALFPAKSPNTDYVGVEMIPCGDGFGTPMRHGLRFTKAQHDSAAALAHEMGGRHGWPEGWEMTSRFVGHEDVQLLNRMDSGGGWDPGFLRSEPYFDFPFVRLAASP